LEGDLPDSLVGAIARKYMRDAFRQGKYSEGLFAGAQSFVATLGEKRGFSVEGLDPGYAVRAPERTADPRRTRPRQGSISFCGLAFIILIVLFFLMAGRRKGGGGGGSGCLNLLLLNSLLNSGGGRGSSGWGGGGFGGSSGSGGWGGGGGGGFGGFSGGGGDAGGGGASFDW
jgi:uncharacterized protein